jgi:hypothetical protein
MTLQCSTTSGCRRCFSFFPRVSVAALPAREDVHSIFFQELRYGREPRAAFFGFLLLASVFIDSAQQITSWSAVVAQSPEYALSLY